MSRKRKILIIFLVIFLISFFFGLGFLLGISFYKTPIIIEKNC